MFDAIGVDEAKAFIGFDVLTGSYTTGSFAGKSKDTCFKTLPMTVFSMLLQI